MFVSPIDNRMEIIYHNPAIPPYRNLQNARIPATIQLEVMGMDENEQQELKIVTTKDQIGRDCPILGKRMVVFLPVRCVEPSDFTKPTKPEVDRGRVETQKLHEEEILGLARWPPGHGYHAYSRR